MMCVLGDFKLLQLQRWLACWPVSLIYIYSHGVSNGKWPSHHTVRSMVLVFAASCLKMGSSALPTIPSIMAMCLRDVLLRHASKSPGASTYIRR